MSGGSQTPFGHVGSVDGTIPEAYGVNPSLAPGLPRPRGWRVALPDGTGAWDKTGPLDTDWSPVAAGAGGDVTGVAQGNGILVSSPGGPVPVVSADYGAGADVQTVMDANDAGTSLQLAKIDHAHEGMRFLSSPDDSLIINQNGPDFTIRQTTVAGWPIANMRIYTVDGVNGDDTNVGFADAAGTTSADYEAAVVAAGAVAKKTVPGLAAIFPRLGSGRLVEVIFAAGSYAGSPADFLNGTTGYAVGCPIVRGTRTVASAAATAFTGTIEDLICAGGVTGTGLHAAGYTDLTAAAAPDAELIPGALVGGGVPDFDDEPNLPYGIRLRFDAATQTASLRNVARQICEVDPITEKLFFQTDVQPDDPAFADVIYLEEPGVVFEDACELNTGSDGGGFYSSGPTFIGIKWADTLLLHTGGYKFVFCQTDLLYSETTGHVQTAQDFEHPVQGTIMVGGGLRCDSSSSLFYGSYYLRGLSVAGQLVIAATGTDVRWDVGCGAEQLVVSECTGDKVTVTHANFGFSTVSSSGLQGLPHLYGFGSAGGILQIRNSEVTLSYLKVTDAGGQAGIRIYGKSTVQFSGDVSGTGANVGLDLTDATDSDVIVLDGAALTKPTITGTLGDIRFAGQAIDTWAALDLEDAWDIAGNHLSQTLDDGVSGGVPQTHRIDRSATAGDNNTGGPLGAFSVVRSIAGGATLALAKASPATVEPTQGVYGILRNATPDGAKGLVGGFSGIKVVEFDAAPTVGATAYLSAVTAGLATTAIPTLGIAIPLGTVVGVRTGNFGLLRIGFEPDTATERARRKLNALGLITETIVDRIGIAGNSMVDGTVYYMAVYLFAGETLTTAHLFVTTAGTTVTLGKVGLYAADGTRLALSANQTAAWEATGLKSIAFGTPYVVPTSGIYYLAVVTKASVLTPQIMASSNSAASTLLICANPIPGGVAPWGSQTGQTDLPSPGVIAAGTAPVIRWIGVN